MTTIEEPIKFNNFNINSIEGWTTTSIDSFRYSSRDLRTNSIARTNKTATSSAFFSGKKLTIGGTLATSSKDVLEQTINIIKYKLQPINKILEIPVANTILQYKEATVANIIVGNQNGGYADISIEFTCSEPYGYETNTTTMLSVSALTSGNVSYPVTIGAYGDQEPTITLTLTSFTTGTNRTITFTNPSTGDYISIQRTWTAAEVLVIDCENKTCKVDGDAVDFEGNYLFFEQGNQYFNYTDDFTARSVNISVVYTARHLQ